MKRAFRLTRSTDIKRVRRLGKSYAHPLVVLVVASSSTPTLRVGVSAGRSVGCAVRRNRAKRVLRACMFELFPYLTAGWDVMVLARQPLVEASYQDTLAALKIVLKKARLLQERQTDGDEDGRSVSQ